MATPSGARRRTKVSFRERRGWQAIPVYFNPKNSSGAQRGSVQVTDIRIGEKWLRVEESRRDILMRIIPSGLTPLFTWSAKRGRACQSLAISLSEWKSLWKRGRELLKMAHLFRSRRLWTVVAIVDVMLELQITLYFRSIFTSMSLGGWAFIYLFLASKPRYSH
jgi:hypothetical protein